MDVTKETLRELGAGDIPVIYVYNKADLCMEDLPKVQGNRIYMSAKQGIGLTELLQMIADVLYADNEETEFLIPYSRGDVVSYLCENAEVLAQNYVESGVHMVVNCRKKDKQKYGEFIVRGE